MNLTVAMKIIGGFAIISLLLIITSLISLSNLNNIHSATLTQSELAIPTLSGSTELANELIQIGNLTLRAYYQTELPPLSNNLTSYNELNASVSNNLKQLKITVKSEPSLLTDIDQTPR